MIAVRKIMTSLLRRLGPDTVDRDLYNLKILFSLIIFFTFLIIVLYTSYIDINYIKLKYTDALYKPKEKGRK